MQFRERRSSCRNDPAFLLAILYTIGFFGFIFSALNREVPAPNKDLISQLLPVLSMIQGGIVQYFYTKAATAIAEKKDETIQQLAKTASTTATTAAVVAGVPVSALPNNPIPVPTPNPTELSPTVDTVNLKAETVNVDKDQPNGSSTPKG